MQEKGGFMISTVSVGKQHTYLNAVTNAQQLVLCAITVATFALTFFAILPLGISQALFGGTLMSTLACITIYDVFRARMVRLSRHRGFVYNSWSVFPEGFFSATSQIRPHKTVEVEKCLHKGNKNAIMPCPQ